MLSVNDQSGFVLELLERWRAVFGHYTRILLLADRGGGGGLDPRLQPVAEELRTLRARWQRLGPVPGEAGAWRGVEQKDAKVAKE